MGVRLEDVEFGVPSHAHYDHSDGLGEFFKRNPTAKFYLQKSAEENCYSRKNFLFKKYIGIRRGYLETYKDRIVYADGDLEVIPGVTFCPPDAGTFRCGKKGRDVCEEEWPQEARRLFP